MERLFPVVHSRRTDGNHPGWWESLTWSKKTIYCVMKGQKAGTGTQRSFRTQLNKTWSWMQTEPKAGPSDLWGSFPAPRNLWFYPRALCQSGEIWAFAIIPNKKWIFQLGGLNLFFPWFHPRDLTFCRKCDYEMKTMRLGGWRSHLCLLKWILHAQSELLSCKRAGSPPAGCCHLHFQHWRQWINDESIGGDIHQLTSSSCLSSFLRVQLIKIACFI